MRRAEGNADNAIDFGSIRNRTGDRRRGTWGVVALILVKQGKHLIDQHALVRANFALQPARRDHLLMRHDPLAALLTKRLRDRIRQRVSAGPGDRRVSKAAHPIEFRRTEKLQQIIKLSGSLTWETRDESAADGQLRQMTAPGLNALEIALAARGAFHPPQDIGMRMLKRYVKVGHEMLRKTRLRHDRNDIVDVRIRINIVETDPGVVLCSDPAERKRQVRKSGPHRLAVDKIGSIPRIDPVR